MMASEIEQILNHATRKQVFISLDTECRDGAMETDLEIKELILSD